MLIKPNDILREGMFYKTIQKAFSKRCLDHCERCPAQALRSARHHEDNEMYCLPFLYKPEFLWRELEKGQMGLLNKWNQQSRADGFFFLEDGVFINAVNLRCRNIS